MVSNKDDVVISGIGGFFPKAINIGEFKDRLFSNESLLEPKWSTGKHGPSQIGCMPPTGFDQSFFGLHRLQADFMAPMHKCALERTFEALLDAGVNPTSLKGKKIGCFMGCTIEESDLIFIETTPQGYGITGYSKNMLANRISYWLDLRGPSVCYNIGWTAGLDVISLANRAMKNGECDAAIVGAYNSISYEEFQQIYEDMGLLSPDGTTKAFDANASGYARSEGCIVMYLQKAGDAKRSYGSVVHVDAKIDCVVPDEITSINESSLITFMEEFYEKCPVKPEEIDYVETYGCALKEIDKTELNAIEKVYCKQRKSPLMIGSVKPQAGHGESCAALISLVKVLVAMETSTIPATLSYESLNPEIRGLTNGSFEVVTTNKTWTSEYAAVNAIGVCNAFGHIVVKRNPKTKNLITADIPVLIPVSTRTEIGMKQILIKLELKRNDQEYQNIIHKVFSKDIPLHVYRGYAIVGKEFKNEHIFYNRMKRPIWFVYSGMGSQWCGMGNDLMKIPIFAESIRKSHEILSKKGVDLIDIITSSDKTIFDNILNCFVGITSIQIALTDILTAIGIVPDGIIGHSAGELGCAYADGCVTAEEIILAAYYRGRASLEVELVTGMMAAVGLGYNRIKDELPENVEVACHNSPDSCTISGPAEDVKKYVQEVKDRNIFVKLVNVANIAYHSRYVRPAAPVLLKYLKEILPKPKLRSSKWISTSNLVADWNTELAKYSSAEYLTNNLLSPVFFEEGCQHVPKDVILIEIAPHGLMQAILRRAFKNATNIPLTSRNSEDGVEFLLKNFGELYLAGANFDISNIYPEIEYPVSRDTLTTSDLVSWNHTESNETLNSLAEKLSDFVQTYEIDLDDEKYQKYVGHKIRNENILPVSFYLDIICQILQPSGEVVFDNLEFKSHLVIPQKSKVPLRVAVFKGSGAFEFRSKNTLLLNGKLIFLDSTETNMVTTPSLELTAKTTKLNEKDLYNDLTYRGYHFSREFKLIKSLAMTEKGSVSTVDCKGKSWMQLVDAMLQQQYMADGEQFQDVHVVTSIRKLVVDPNNLEKEDLVVHLNSNYVTNMISTKGIQLFDIKTTSYQQKKKEVVLYANDLIPLKGMQFQKLEAGIEFALKITLANFVHTDTDRIFISVMLPVDDSFMEALIKVIEHCSAIQINLSKYTDPKEIFVQQVYPQLLITANKIDKEILKIVSSSSAFLLSRSNEPEGLPDAINKVAQYFMEGQNCWILKKTNKADICMVPVQENRISIQDFESPPAKWVTELYETVANNKTKDVYLLTSVIPQEGYKTFAEAVRRKNGGLNHVRFLFNIDNSNFELSSVYRTGLYSSVVKNGIPYTHVSLSVEYKNNILLCSNETFKVDDREIQYVSPNLKDETVIRNDSRKLEISSCDYSGINESGNRIMGIANIEQNSGALQLDETLMWEVPENWSLQEAASVPYAYVSAYYLMVIKGGLQPGMSVLINSACSPIGLAAVAIAIQYRCSIYCTVYTTKQKAFLKELSVPETRIFLMNNSLLTADVKLATGGVGVQLVLNSLPDTFLRNTFTCCAHFANVIHYGRYDVENNTYVDMQPFLRNVSFYVVDVGNLVSESKEIKQELWRLVADGLVRNAVVPLKITCVDRITLPPLLRKMREGTSIGKVLLKVNDYFPITTLGTGKPYNFSCKPDHCYLVYGGSAELWSQVVEWLVHHGAKKVIISSGSKSQQNDINRRLALLNSYFDANIIEHSNKSISPMDMISECQQYGEIDGVFVVSNKSKNGDEIFHLDQALRQAAPKVLFVNFVDSAAGICQRRRDDGLPAYYVQLANRQNLKTVVNVLDDILTSHSTHIEVVEVPKRHSSSIDAGKFLPTLDEILTEQNQILSSEAHFVQIKTEGPTEIRELAPLFVIAGPMSQNQINELAKKLLYPTYCAMIPSTSLSLIELAEIYSQEMKKIYPKNVYNLVSVSTGSVLLTEIARKLKQSKPEAVLNIFFIDNAPNYVQEVLTQLGESKDDVETNMLRYIFKINDIKVYQKLTSVLSWNQKIKYASEHLGLSENSFQLLEGGLKKLKNMIGFIKTYKPKDYHMPGKIHLIRPEDVNHEDSCGLTSYFDEPAKIKLIKCDHLNIVSHPDTIDYINFYADV